jgi:arsenate reductase (thioredoxin)
VGVTRKENGSSPKTVLFVGHSDSCRSQIAAAIFNRLANSKMVRAVSAGIRPARHVHPQLRLAMLEIGIDLRDAVPRLVSPDGVANSHVLITMGCGDSCPTPYALPRDEWPLPDAPGPSLEHVRGVRDEIASRVKCLVAAHPWE